MTLLLGHSRLAIHAAALAYESERLTTVLDHDLALETRAPIPTWFKVGGRADRLARPRSAAQLRACLELAPNLVVLGDGANLLVDDDGIDRLVVAFTDPAMAEVRWPQSTSASPSSQPTIYAPAGASLFKMIPEAVRRGLAGLEGLGGIPATIGGAVVMNAGGAFGQIADAIVRVHAMDRAGRELWLERDRIAFTYRSSGLAELIVLGAELRLTPDDPAALRRRFKDVMEYKKRTQPMDAASAGCAFKNPEAPPALFERLGVPVPEGHRRISAGLLIDRAGCKGLRVGSAEVSQRHGNFLFARAGPEEGGRAGDVIELMERVRTRVLEELGVRLENEVVVWRRGQRGRRAWTR